MKNIIQQQIWWPGDLHSAEIPRDHEEASVMVDEDEVLFDDTMEEQIEAEIVAHLFRSTAPQAYR